MRPWFATFAVLFSLRADARSETLATLDQALQRSFPEAASFSAQAVDLDAVQQAAVEAALGRASWDARTLFVRALDSAGNWLGCAFVEDELGKHRPITFLVALDASDAVRGVELLTYREAQGSEIRSRRFLAQFRGRRQGDPLKLGAGVDAVSGATISSKTIAYGVRKALHLRAHVSPFNQAGTAPSAPKKGTQR